MRVGITGSRHGTSPDQWGALIEVLRGLWSPGLGGLLHHGDCVGVDREAAEIARGLGFRIAAHPPTDDRLRAYFPSDVTLPPADYLTRDRAIVDAVDVLVGCPDGPERPKSGTWYTIRYARKKGVPTLIVDRHGNVTTRPGVHA